MPQHAANQTVKTIARLAGVTPGVVSAALRDKVGASNRFSKATGERIRRIARELGYRPHGGARAVRTRRFQTLGVVAARSYATPERTLRPLNVPLIDGINDACMERDYCLSLLRVNRLPEMDRERWPRLLAESRVDGLIITGNSPPELQAFVEAERLPAIWVNTNLRAAHDCIYYDEVSTGRKVARYLLEWGHRRIAFLKSASEIHYSAPDRHRGYLEELAAWGVEPYPGHERLIADDEFADVITGLLHRLEPPTAMIPTYHVTDRLLPIMYREGWRVPEDISVLDWADPAGEAARMVPPATAMVGDSYAVGKLAVAMVLEKIEGSGRPVPSRVLEWEILPGQTVGPPPAAARAGSPRVKRRLAGSSGRRATTGD